MKFIWEIVESFKIEKDQQTINNPVNDNCPFDIHGIGTGWSARNQTISSDPIIDN